MTIRSYCAAALGALAAAGVLGWSSAAEARGIIRNPGDHTKYSLELEPHGVFTGAFRFRKAYRTHSHLHAGAGVRFSIPVMDPGFVTTINDSVAISFGVDFVDDHYWYGWTVYSPVVLQWNFYLHEKWSVFGEPGLVFFQTDFFNRFDADLAFFAGGRYHFSDTAALTMRLGWPSLSVGVSFLL